MTENLVKCGSCKSRQNCPMGSLFPVTILPDELSFDERLKDPFFTPIGQYEPIQRVDPTDIHLDMSSYFSIDMRQYILNNLLDNRIDPYLGTSDQSSTHFPIYDVDIPFIHDYRTSLTFTFTDLLGIDFFINVSELIIHNDAIFTLDLRNLIRLKRLQVNGLYLRAIYLPTVADINHDYENEITYGIRLATPMLTYLDNRTMKETKAGWLNLENISHMDHMKYLFIPDVAINQDFTFVSSNIVTTSDTIDNIRIQFKLKEIFESPQDPKYYIDLKDYLRFDYDLVDEIMSEISSQGVYDGSNHTFTWNSLEEVPSGFYLSDKIIALINKEDFIN